MPRNVGKSTTPGRALVSFVARNTRLLTLSLVLLVLVSSGGAAAEPAADPASTGLTTIGP